MMRYGFYETPAEREMDAFYTSEREAERRANAEIEARMQERENDPRRYCENIQHILGGDCPNCTPDICFDCNNLMVDCTCPRQHGPWRFELTYPAPIDDPNAEGPDECPF